MNTSEVLNKLKNKEEVELEGFDFSGYFNHKEEYLDYKSKAEELGIERSKFDTFMKKHMGANTYRKLTDALKSIDYAIMRLEELEGILAIREAMKSGSKEAFNEYKIYAFPRYWRVVKDIETGEYGFKIKTIFSKRAKEVYWLTYRGGFSNRIKSPVHEALVERAKEMIETHPLTIGREPHLITIEIPHPERDDGHYKDGEFLGEIYPLDFRITVDREPQHDKNN